MLFFVAATASPMQNGQLPSTLVSAAAQTGVVLSKLSQPIYPAIPRSARVSGDVEMKLGIRKDGSIASAVVVGGPSMLHQAALDSARQSQFECRGCSDEVTLYSLIYSFQLATAADASRIDQQSRGIKVVLSQNRVTII